jgi:hypothetical protein
MKMLQPITTKGRVERMHADVDAVRQAVDEVQQRIAAMTCRELTEFQRTTGIEIYDIGEPVWVDQTGLDDPCCIRVLVALKLSARVAGVDI